MKTKFYIIILILCLTQTRTYSQYIENQISLDSISNITINKIIFYKAPLIFTKGELDSSEYTPAWNEAASVVADAERLRHKNAYKAKYIQKRLGIDEKSFADHEKDTVNLNRTKRHYQQKPASYYYCEIWFQIKSTGENVVLAINTELLKDKTPLKIANASKNNIDEFDTKEGTIINPEFYIYEDGILKFADQSYYMHLLKNNKSWIKFDLKSIKDLIFRSKNYTRSILVKGKRVFQLVENTPNGIIIKEEKEQP